MNSPTISTESFTCNGRHYHPGPHPIVVICVDGCADEYLSTSMAQGVMPHLLSLTKNGYRGLARGALPSFTNVNNASIATGLSPREHGISGNFFLDPDTEEEIMMNSSKYLWKETLLSHAAQSGRKVGMVTAKEKLRDILSHQLEGIAFSSEKAKEAKLDTHGIENVESLIGEPAPEIYSADASLYVLKAGVALIREGLADFLYLSLTDYMQHKFCPWEEESLTFHQNIDEQIGLLLELGAKIGITADHGMNSKTQPDGSANVIFLESWIQDQLGIQTRVICPITDPYVVHHGALGSLVMVHIEEESDIPRIQEKIFQLDGITEVYTRSEAAHRLELPEERIGDLVILSGRDTVIGRTEKDHDLSHVAKGLRSHGGRYEEMVPFIFSFPLNSTYLQKAVGDPRNFDVFEFTCNGEDS